MSKLQEAPTYRVPPEVIAAGSKLFGLSFFQIFIMMVATLLSFLLLIFLPIGFVLIRILTGIFFWMIFSGYFLLPMPNLTSFEQTVSYFSRSKIPSKTAAIPLPPPNTRNRSKNS
jgi:hypothetical protein